jgi:ribonuclease HII
VRFSDATFTFYKSGTLYCTPTQDPAVVAIWDEIQPRSLSGFVSPSRDYLIGLDETGKGEVLGHTVLTGVMIPKPLFDQISKIIGVADTKKKHTFAYWDNILKNLDQFKSQTGLVSIIETIPPWHIDKFNINSILDIVYQRILSNFARLAPVTSCRIVVDDYGVGKSLRRYVKSLGNAGAEVIVAHQADDNYLEAKVASLIAKREREKTMETISKSEQYKCDGIDIGSGNAGDPETVKWLQCWKRTGRQWPWFVKCSFRTVRELDGVPEPKKERPPIRDDILSEEFRRAFSEGKFSITSLTVVCPACGVRSRAVLVTHQNGLTSGRCVDCKQSITGLNLALRYYCGFVLPDSNIIVGGLLSKDLEQSKFFEGFTVLFDPVVKKEIDTRGGRSELEKLARFAAINRIKLQDIEIGLAPANSTLERDEQIKDDALRYNAILITGDNAMKAFAQSKSLFCFYV